MQFYPLSDIREAVELLERPIRPCDLWHESIDRTKSPRIAEASRFELKVLDLNSECAFERKHGGCPHLLERLTDLLGNIRHAFIQRADIDEIFRTMDEWRSHSIRLDTSARIARTGGADAGPAIAQYVPVEEQIQRDVEPIVNEYRAMLNNPQFIADRSRAAVILRGLLI